MTEIFGEEEEIMKQNQECGFRIKIELHFKPRINSERKMRTNLS